MLESNKIFEWVYINKTDNVFGRNAGGQPEIVRFMVNLAFVCRFCPLPADSVQQIDKTFVYARKLFCTAHTTDSSKNPNVCELLTQACHEDNNNLPNTEVHFAVHHSTFHQWDETRVNPLRLRSYEWTKKHWIRDPSVHRYAALRLRQQPRNSRKSLCTDTENNKLNMRYSNEIRATSDP